MPKGPKGEKRPADVIGNVVHVMRIATGEVEGGQAPENPAAVLGRRGGATRAKTSRSMASRPRSRSGTVPPSASASAGSPWSAARSAKTSARSTSSGRT